MNSCGSLESLSGGTLVRTTIIGSSINDSAISGSTFATGDITNLVSIDEASASTIVDTIAKLPTDKLTALAAAIFSALQLKRKDPAVQPTVAESLPTAVQGSRELLLGKPDAWLVLQAGTRVPAYK